VIPAGDGCNTCTCQSDGSWDCTQEGCFCEPGETKDANDGCNTCFCEDGFWICTNDDCPGACLPPKPNVAGCPSLSNYWAKNPISGKCCKYPDACAQPDGWVTFFDEEECNKAP
jgi:hypothetical protein